MQNLISNTIGFMGDQAEPHIEVGTADLAADGNPIFMKRASDSHFVRQQQAETNILKVDASQPKNMNRD